MSGHKSDAKKQYARLYGILAPACSGKTSLFNKLRSYTIKLKKGKAAIPLILIDIDEMKFEQSRDVRSNDSSSAEHKFPLLKDKVDETLSRYPKYRAIVISSNPELLKYLNIKERHIRVFVQGLPLFVQGIFPLLNVPAKSLKENDDDNDDSNSEEDDRDARPPNKPLPIPGLLTSNTSKARPTRSASTNASPVPQRRGGFGAAGRSTSFEPFDGEVAPPLPARLALEMASITGAIITVKNEHGTDNTYFDFSKEVVDVCRSRDRIMLEYKETLQMYDTYEDFFNMVVEEFGITYRLK